MTKRTSVFNCPVFVQAQLLMLRENPRDVLCDREFVTHFLVTEKPDQLDAIITMFCDSLSTDSLTKLLDQVREEVQFLRARDEVRQY